MSWIEHLRGVRYQCKYWYLTPIILSLLLSNPLAAEPLRIDGSTGVKPLVQALAKEFENSQPSVTIEMGTGLNPVARIQALQDGHINIAMASHGIDVEQIAKQGLQVHRIAKMAVVLGVNQTVTVSNLSEQQLCDIYSGKLDNWRSLGGRDASITPFIRPFDEVDTEVVSAHIACFSQPTVNADIQLKKKSGHMARALASTQGAIGMTTMVRVAQSDGNIQALALNGVSPDSTNLLSGAYTLTRDSFLITEASPSKAVSAFLAFVRSEKGTAIIMANDAVPAR